MMDKRNSKERHLGDEWLDWEGNLEEYESNVDEGKRLFIIFSGIVLIIFLTATIFFLYMITPRLVQISPALSSAAWIISGALAFCIIGWFVLMVRSALTEKPSLFSFWGKRMSINYFIPLATKLGMKFGISKDRIWNSFIKVSNSLTRSRRQKTFNGRLLVLLPRCLKPSLKKELMEFSKCYHCEISVVPGGMEARRVAYDYKPEAIVGVACERDLLVGIQDFASRIPVLGIPNQRPEGPCKGCTVDLNQIKDAIEFFTGKK